jgi:hypothetical protein
MDMAFAFFADSATVPPDGKLYVLGGGFSAIALPQLPGRAGFAVVAGFRFGVADVSGTHTVELRFVDSEGKLVLPVANLQFQAAGALPPGQEQVTVSTVTHLAPTFGEPGTYTAEFWKGDRLLQSVALTVAEQAPGGAGAAGALGPRPN